MPRDPFRSTPNLSPFGPGNNSYTSTPSSHSSRSMGLGFGSGSFSSPYGSFPDSDARRLSSRSASGSVAEKYSLAADPRMWGYSVSPDSQDDDDWLHNPDPKRDKANDFGSSLFTVRGCTNIGCLLVLGIALLGLFAGYPVATYFTRSLMSTNGGFNLGGTNASGQVPSIGNFGLIDLDTPEDVYSITSYTDGSTTMQLVFSDEFNEDGRSFYPGDDPFWEAGTNNLEWYDPSAVTTKNGSLVITLSKEDPETNHGLDYRGAMITSWNKFCFTGGMILTSVMLPGANNVLGLWPAVWAMGNLGRAGYGASLDGMWPYTYDACDVGTLKNQTLNGRPADALTTGTDGGTLSYLPGQRLSRCTCTGESHPGPVHSDGTYVGRAAPEIDVFEAQVSNDVGYVSQSGQWGPFNAYYEWYNTTDNFVIYDEGVTELNSYTGGVYQQATSGISKTAQDCYQLDGGCFAVYGFEYKAGYDDAFISWINNDKTAWTLKAAGMAADDRVEISARPVPQEPMYLLVNLGISENFGYVDFEHLTFPAIMTIDWIRVYQNQGSTNIGCDPTDFPTAAYIAEYNEAYTNPNLTTWVDDYKQTIPKNNLTDSC